MKDFKKLVVWERSMGLVKKVFEIIDQMDKTDQFILASQIGRCATSIPSNIAEGCGRNSDKELARFLDISLGSSFELETQLRICLDRPRLENEKIESALNELIEIQRMIQSLTRKVRERIK